MNIKDLLVWQVAIDLVVSVYEISEAMPMKEQFGLQSQMRRAAVSIPANIAEGYGRSGTNEYLRFLDIAMGSLRELETHVEIARRLGYFESSSLQMLMDKVGKIIYSTRKTLKNRKSD